MNERMPPGRAGSVRLPYDESCGGRGMTRAKRNPCRGVEA